jgi:putative tryptophan/tyrosine transport system substrate-binding protein
MRRRDFISLIGGAAATWPFPARAQQAAPMRRIGALTSLSDGDERGKAAYESFRKRLEELGWIVGRNLHIDHRWGKGDPNLIRAYAAELVTLKPAALHAFSTPAVAALLQKTQTIPVVFVGVTDPVGNGFVNSFAYPGRNATGFTNYEPTIPGKWLELLREIAPRTFRVAALFNPVTAPYATKFYIAALESAGLALAIQITAASAREPTDIETILSEFAREPGGGLIVIPDSFTIVHRRRIISVAEQSKLPAIYPYRYVGPEGALVAYGYDEIESYPRSAEYIDRILKGENPHNLPVQAPSKFVLVINLKTAKALGLTVPLHLQQAADEIIE